MIGHIFVRQAQPDDAEQIYQVLATSVRTLCASDYTSEQLEAAIGNSNVEFYQRAIAQKCMAIFVADAGYAVIGFASLCNTLLGDLFVHPLYVRRGVGTSLLAAVEGEAMHRNIDKLRVTASITAQPFYLSRGYQFIKDSFVTNSETGVQVPCVDMEKWLCLPAELTRQTPRRASPTTKRMKISPL